MAASGQSEDAAHDQAAAPGLLALTLGYAGLIPFVGSVLMLWFETDLLDWAIEILLVYGAVITSFLGGIHWGLAMRAEPADAGPREVHLLWGVAPSIVGWIAVLLPSGGLWLLVVLLLACWGVDSLIYPRLGLGRWLGLRAQLTLVASTCCLLGALAI